MSEEKRTKFRDGSKVYSAVRDKWRASWADGTPLRGDNDQTSYFDSYEEAVEQLQVSEEEVSIITHSLGLGQSKRPYRTHYCTTPNDARLMAMVSRGLMTEGAIINEGRSRYFHVTELGATAVGSSLPKD